MEILRLVKQHVGSTNLKSLKKPTLPMLQTTEGKSCQSPDQLRNEWINFFGQMEGGVRMTWPELVATWQANLHAFQQQQVCLGPDDIWKLRSEE